MPRSFVPTDEQRRRVKMLASLGQRHEHIAMVVGIRSTTTLGKHFREERTRGPAEAMANVRKTLFQMATSGKHPAATMFWLKTRARWSEQGREPEPEDAPKAPCIVVQFIKPPRRTEDGEIRTDRGRTGIRAHHARGVREAASGGENFERMARRHR